MNKIRVSIGFSEENGEWLAVIHDGEEIICVGCEPTQEMARKWANEAVAYHTGEAFYHPQDMYDRNSVSRH